MWTLRRGETLLGSIEVTGGEASWFGGSWLPEVAFAEVATLFDRELSLLDDDAQADDWARAYSAIWDAGIHLHDPNGQAVPQFILHVLDTTVVFRTNS